MRLSPFQVLYDVPRILSNSYPVGRVAFSCFLQCFLHFVPPVPLHPSPFTRFTMCIASYPLLDPCIRHSFTCLHCFLHHTSVLHPCICRLFTYCTVVLASSSPFIALLRLHSHAFYCVSRIMPTYCSLAFVTFSHVLQWLWIFNNKNIITREKKRLGRTKHHKAHNK